MRKNMSWVLLALSLVFYFGTEGFCQVKAVKDPEVQSQEKVKILPDEDPYLEGDLPEEDLNKPEVKTKTEVKTEKTEIEDSEAHRRGDVKSMAYGIGASLVLGFLAAFIVKGFLLGQLKSVYKKTEARSFVAGTGLKLSEKYDQMTHTTESRVYDPKDKDEN